MSVRSRACVSCGKNFPGSRRAHLMSVERNGQPGDQINKSLRTARRLAVLDDSVVPHTLRYYVGPWTM